LAASYIGLKDYASAKAASDKLITDYSGNPNIAQAVFEVADTYCWFGKNKEAQELYQKVIDTWPDAEHSMWAQMGLAISYIADGNDAAALAATDRLAENYAKNEKLPEALTYIASRYVWNKKYQQGLDIYSYIIEKFPGNTWAEGAKFESAKVSVYPFIDANDEPNTLAAIDSLINGFKEKAELPAAVYDFAARVDWKNKHDPNDFTENLCQIIIEQFPNTQQAIMSQMILSRIDILTLIGNNDEPNALSAVDKYVSDYNYLAEQCGSELCIIAEHIYNKAMISKFRSGLDANTTDLFNDAIGVWEKVQNNVAASKYTPQSYFASGVIYSQELGNYAKGLEYFQKMAEEWPEQEHSDWANLLAARYCEQLKNSGAIEKETADEMIEKSYMNIIENYPASKLVFDAYYNLGNLRFRKSQLSEAAESLELALQKAINYENPYNITKASYLLGQVYERSEQKDMAADIYKMALSVSDANDRNWLGIEQRLNTLEGEVK